MGAARGFRVAARRAATAVALVLAATLAAPAGTASATATGPYTVTPVAGDLTAYRISGVYVAGVSSGAYLAGQLQVAYSSRIKGTAVFGAGPYYCAENNAEQALYGCMQNTWPDHLPTLEGDAALWSSYGWVDPVSDLSGRPVWVYHGAQDTTIASSVSADGAAFWSHFGANVTSVTGAGAGHAWVTPYGTNACGTTGGTYLNNCGTDPEHDLLAKLLGSVNAADTGPLQGSLIRFDQDAYAVTGSAASLDMGAAGFAYVPSACAAGQGCRLLVALHGCSQGYDAVGTAFVDRANLDQYADTNNLIVLYPQATTSAANPYGCWDWWGYLGVTNYPIQGGAQIETVMNMVAALGGA
ncbi:extracellular catalytic domain type 2 short-chain-length polyhydroxyalkanoate depolymerase [Streptacidiphilus jiangxiensis]|nr:PHB depolymerase family esterase [Streptacidiphilus jiangxiensis]